MSANNSEKKGVWKCEHCGINYLPTIPHCMFDACPSVAGAEKKPEPWKIEENSSGFIYIVDHDGKKICTVYGNEETKLQRAMAIAELPVLLYTLKKYAA